MRGTEGGTILGYLGKVLGEFWTGFGRVSATTIFAILRLRLAKNTKTLRPLRDISKFGDFLEYNFPCDFLNFGDGLAKNTATLCPLHGNWGLFVQTLREIKAPTQ